MPDCEVRTTSVTPGSSMRQPGSRRKTGCCDQSSGWARSARLTQLVLGEHGALVGEREAARESIGPAWHAPGVRHGAGRLVDGEVGATAPLVTVVAQRRRRRVERVGTGCHGGQAFVPAERLAPAEDDVLGRPGHALRLRGWRALQEPLAVAREVAQRDDASADLGHDLQRHAGRGQAHRGPVAPGAVAERRPASCRARRAQAARATRVRARSARDWRHCARATAAMSSTPRATRW